MDSGELIKSLEDEIKAKKLMLRALKDDAKARNKKLFSETKAGKAYLKSLVTITKPFHRLYETASNHLQSPVMAHFGGLTTEAEALIREATLVKSGDKNATSTANRCAELILEIGAFKDKRELPAFCEADKYILELKEHMTRLRPPADPNQFAVLSSQLEAAVPQA